MKKVNIFLCVALVGLSGESFFARVVFRKAGNRRFLAFFLLFGLSGGGHI